MNQDFSKFAVAEFAFLEDAGFVLVAASDAEVIFRSDRLAITVGWDRRSGEIEVYLQRLDRFGKESPFSLRDVLSMEDSTAASYQQPLQVFDAELVPKYVASLARRLQAANPLAIAGDRIFYSRLEQYRSKNGFALIEEMRSRSARIKAASAWRAKDYGCVIEQLETIQSSLSKAEQKMLSISRQRTKK